ncbi:MAG: YceI family protein [Pyrinomonadaceae bacterium]
MIRLPAVLLCMLSLLTAAPAPIKYSADANHSTVGFSIPILNGVSKVRGKFTNFTVSLEYDEANIANSSVNVIIKTASIDTGIEARDKHLRTEDFFDVEKYPEITFKSKRVEKKGKHFLVTGDLSMHGVTKELAIPFMVSGRYVNAANQQAMVGFLANLSLNRRDYGMIWKHSAIPNFVGDIVHIDLAVLVRADMPKKPA